MRAMLEVQSGFLPVEGGRLYYETAGQGQPLVMIHAGIADSRMWTPQWDAFAQRCRVIRYDTRGYGKTTTDSVEFSNRADLQALLDHLEVEQAVVIGCSRGGQIAVDFTLEFPERVRALIPVAAGLGGFQFEEPKHEREKFIEMDQLYDKGDFARLTDLEVEVWVDGFQRTPDQVDPQVRKTVRQMIAANYARKDGEPKPIVLAPPAAGRLAEIKAPTLVIVGDLDTSDTRAAAEALARGIPGAKYYVVKGTAHLPNMERPDEFNHIVLEFLSALT